MITPQIYVTECNHQRWHFDRIVGIGYQMRYESCGVKGVQHPIASKAMESFDKTVNKCRGIEKRTGEAALAHQRIADK